MQLNEGLQELDLQDLVLPLLSIDEFESKIDEDAIVIGFFVQDHEPAKDLERFIQKSAINLLDTEVSTAPDSDGFFMLFVELTRSPTTIDRILEIIESLVGLTGMPAKSWKFKAYNHEGVFPVDSEQLGVLAHFNQPEDKEADEEKAETNDKPEDDSDDMSDLNEFFSPSLLDTFQIDGNILVLERRGRRIELEIMGFGSIILAEKHGLVGRPLRIDDTARLNERRVESMLGENWGVNTVDGVMMVRNSSSPDMLLARMV